MEKKRKKKVQPPFHTLSSFMEAIMRNDWFQPLRVVSFFIQNMKVFLKNIRSETLSQFFS